ncbi:hypothetical protein NPIL_603831 [Nephila pilipes]|uniref:Uncharacterized protein n=1 Tax=Nephila pilipes TaxID=299642 RepID=A0A8X6IT48_NEPPI|nr:hypothetical protein NPIL_603831 [Nephila pilipes]
MLLSFLLCIRGNARDKKHIGSRLWNSFIETGQIAMDGVIVCVLFATRKAIRSVRGMEATCFQRNLSRNSSENVHKTIVLCWILPDIGCNGHISILPDSVTSFEEEGSFSLPLWYHVRPRTNSRWELECLLEVKLCQW